MALPPAIAAIGGGEALGDGEAIAVGLERLLELALRHKHVADTRQPDGISGSFLARPASSPYRRNA